VDVSKRAARMPASAIRKLVPFADAARKRGVHIYHLNIGQPDIPTPREMIDAYRAYDEPVLAYGHSAGLLEYRESLSRYYERYDISVSAEQILVTTGGSEAIIFALMAVCGDGDNILVPEPFYTNYMGFAVMAGVEVRPIPTSPADGFHLPPRAVIEAGIDDRCVTSPWSTGCTWSRTRCTASSSMTANATRASSTSTGSRIAAS
jgi:aspartate aminotransferase